MWGYHEGHALLNPNRTYVTVHRPEENCTPDKETEIKKCPRMEDGMRKIGHFHIHSPGHPNSKYVPDCFGATAALHVRWISLASGANVADNSPCLIGTYNNWKQAEVIYTLVPIFSLWRHHALQSSSRAIATVRGQGHQACPIEEVRIPVSNFATTAFAGTCGVIAHYLNGDQVIKMAKYQQI